MRYTERLADAGIKPSVGSRHDSYDNALAESVIGLFKTEVIRRLGFGAISRPSNSPRSTLSIGSTIVGCWSHWATCLQRSTRRALWAHRGGLTHVIGPFVILVRFNHRPSC